MTKQSNSFTQKEAQQCARLFNVLFNSAMLYGGTHQTTLKSVQPFFEVLSDILSRNSMISLVIDRKSLFFEEWPLEKVINPKRILQQFEKTGIVSVTFKQGITRQTIESFIKYACDSTITPVKKISSRLQKEGHQSIQLNYVRYGRITNDQTLIGKEEEVSQTQNSGSDIRSSEDSTKSLKQLEEIISLTKLFKQTGGDNPEISGNEINPSITDNAVKSLSQVRNSLHLLDGSSMDLLLNAVYELKMDLSESIAVQKETGKLLTAAKPIKNEMNALTCDVIIKLVKEEFGSGDISIRRLAQIIIRMLPDTEELKQLLPQLKTALIDAGMSISQYLELVRTLNLEFESETLADTLSHAATGIGATVGELVGAIQSQPDEAARLLVMASEIKKGVRDDETQLSSMLTGYIEKVSTEIALQSDNLSDENGSTTLKLLLERLEKDLLSQLKKYGVEDSVLSQVRALLSQRRDTTFDQATEQWIYHIIANEQLSPNELTEQLVQMIKEQAQLDRLHRPLTEAFAKRGFNREETESILKRLSRRIAAGKMIKLPPGALSPNNMVFLLNRELKCQDRYHTALSILVISPVGFLYENQFTLLQDNELQLVLSQLYTITKKEIRDIDVIGNIGGVFERALFIIMTMTDENGAYSVKDRIQEKISTYHYQKEEREVTILAASSIIIPEPDVKYDIKTFLEYTLQRHNQDIKQCKEQYGR